jgi:hypothetical protein
LPVSAFVSLFLGRYIPVLMIFAYLLTARRSYV